MIRNWFQKVFIRAESAKFGSLKKDLKNKLKIFKIILEIPKA